MDQTPERTSETPELEKEKRAREEGCSQAIGDFVEWLGEQGYALCKWADAGAFGAGRYKPTHESTRDLLCAYFGIDQKKAERERSALLQHLREANGITD